MNTCSVRLSEAISFTILFYWDRLQILGANALISVPFEPPIGYVWRDIKGYYNIIVLWFKFYNIVIYRDGEIMRSFKNTFSWLV